MQTLTEPIFTAQDEAALREMFDAAARHVLTGDWASWAGVYSEDGLFKPANGPVIRGRPNILAWAQALPNAESLEFQKVEVWGEGNVAYGTSGYTFKLKGLPCDAGHQLVVFRRSTKGAPWKLVAASVSSDFSQAPATQ